jgi:phosphoribosylformylglycinamidine synthase
VKPDDIRVAILRMEGTNCEHESYRAFVAMGAQPRFVHLKELERRQVALDDFQCLFIPGGFSAGDYVRAGTIFASRLRSHALSDLHAFVEGGYPVIGVCNGFQVLIELGLLPALHGISDEPEAALTTNDSSRFECRQTLLRSERSPCRFTKCMGVQTLHLIPSAHKEGKLVFKSDAYAQEVNEKLVVFRYADEQGSRAGYPWNPNGSYQNIAGICNSTGTVLGMMPHPERAVHPWQNCTWQRGDGRALFKGIVNYIKKTW